MPFLRTLRDLVFAKRHSRVRTPEEEKRRELLYGVHEDCKKTEMKNIEDEKEIIIANFVLQLCRLLT